MAVALETPPTADAGAELYALVAELFPICRSVAGPGVRQTLEILGRHVPLAVREVASGTKVFDWTVPREWHFRSAYIADRSGRRIVKAETCNLHVVNFSLSVQRRMTLAELRPHLHTSLEHPSWIPYRTSYYTPAWGFCLSHDQFERLEDDVYDVSIDAEHVDGSLSYGEVILPGSSSDEVLIAAHVCHPSLANDNLSGIAVATLLAERLQHVSRRYTYRFVFAPATIGALCWLAANPHARTRVKAGLVLTLLGDPGHFTYKRSRRGNALVDRAAEHVLKHSNRPYRAIDFSPLGYDERQYGSPGFDLPVGCLMRSPHGEFSEYHTSADNLDFVRPEALAESLERCWSIVEALEHNSRYVNRRPYGEPQLGRRGLYAAMGGGTDTPEAQAALLWTLNLSDGRHDLLAVAERSGLPMAPLGRAAAALAERGLVAPVESPAEALSGHTSSEWRDLAHRLIPGGCHTYAKGDDQYPSCAPAAIVRGAGSHVWDVEGREYIEYGAGLRSVTLGHGFACVVDAAARQLALGTNFNRPSTIEIEAAEELAAILPGAEMVKFAKNASDCTTAAVKLARACTGRDLVALCGDQPFFSTDDWYIGTTAMAAGIPKAVRSLSLTFRYNDPASLEELFATNPGQIACVVLEPATVVEPAEGFLSAVRALCDRHGALLVFDETITGFRWHLGGGQAYYGVTADLAAYGKALGNGLAVSALTGRREFMEHGGLSHNGERVFLLSTTHGAETHALAAAREVIRTYREEPVIATLWRQGERLKLGSEAAVRWHNLAEYVQIVGPPCNLVYATRNERCERSQAFRTLFLQELLQRGVLAPSLVVNYSHSDDDIDRTLTAIDGALGVYAAALRDGVEKYLVGPSVKPVFRQFNA